MWSHLIEKGKNMVIFIYKSIRCKMKNNLYKIRKMLRIYDILNCDSMESWIKAPKGLNPSLYYFDVFEEKKRRNK